MLYPKISIQNDSKKVEAISKWPVPTNVTEVAELPWVYQLLS